MHTYLVWDHKNIKTTTNYGKISLKLGLVDELPRNTSSCVIIPNVSAVSRIMMPLTPVKEVALHSATARNLEGNYSK